MRTIRLTFGLLVALLVLSACGKNDAPPPTDLEIPAPTQPAKVAIVFVHGVLGDAITSFGADSENNWPRLLSRDPEIGPGADISSVSYASEPLREASNINEIATRLLLRLRDGNVFTKHDKVIFIVHSMGGLVTKRLLVQLRLDSPSEYAKVAGIFFLATPAGGSDAASWASWISGNPQFRDMKPVDFNTLLQALEDDWQAQLRARTSSTPYPRAFCIYETQSMGPLKIVPRSTSQSGCDDRQVAFDRNHTSLVKPTTRKDEVYKYVAQRIKRIVAGEEAPLSLSATLLTANNEPLPNDSVLKSGSQFAIQVNTNRDAWFYVISQDSSGRIQRAFPSASTGIQPSAARTQRIPKDSTVMLQLDKRVGVDRLYVLASLSRNSELETRYAGVSNKPLDAEFDDLKVTLEKRGLVIAKVNPAATPKVATPRFNATSTGADAVGEFVIEHQ